MEFKCQSCGTTNPKHFDDFAAIRCVECEEIHEAEWEAECEADELWGEDLTEETGD